MLKLMLHIFALLHICTANAYCEMTTGNSSLKHLDELVDPDITAKVRIKQTNKKSAITIPTKINRGEELSVATER
jgi:hypothetical protein